MSAGNLCLPIAVLVDLPVEAGWCIDYRRAAESRSEADVSRNHRKVNEEACASDQYTHVHLLAHGVPVAKGDDRRYGVALLDCYQPGLPEVVDGARLAKAVRPPREKLRTGFARPVVVTLAACDAGNVGSVVGAGASIAHSLHEEGIPLVVASQFPLSFAGSVIMAKVLYEGFLLGLDPRILLINLRRQRKTQAPATHDWASIVAYASLPADLEQQLGRIRMKQALRSLDAAINHADRMLSEEPGEPELQAQRGRLGKAWDRIETLLTQPRPDTSVYGVLASSEKRLAQILWRMKEAAPRSSMVTEFRADVRERLISSRRYYHEAFHQDRSQGWALVQVLALTAVLQRWNPTDVITKDQWSLARILSEEKLNAKEPRRVAWAHANLMELYLLPQIIKPKSPVSIPSAQAKCRDHADAFRKTTDLEWVEIHSTKRQLIRYSKFFAEVNEELLPLAAQADALAGLLPESLICA